MKFKAEINVMPLEELLDPQGKTVARNMDHAGIFGADRGCDGPAQSQLAPPLVDKLKKSLLVIITM